MLGFHPYFAIRQNRQLCKPAALYPQGNTNFCYEADWTQGLMNANRRIRSLENFQGPYRELKPETSHLAAQCLNQLRQSQKKSSTAFIIPKLTEVTTRYPVWKLPKRSWSSVLPLGVMHKTVDAELRVHSSCWYYLLEYSVESRPFEMKATEAPSDYRTDRTAWITTV
jgi:hypothetical protein